MQSDSLKTMTRSVMPAVCLATLAVVVQGCGLPSHVHDPERLKTAEKALDAMGEYSVASPEIYAQLESNVDTFAVLEDELIADYLRNYEQFVLVNILQEDLDATKARIRSLRWGAENAESGDWTIENTRQLLLDEIKAQLKSRGQAVSNINDLTAALQAAKKAVADAAGTVTEWNRTSALLSTISTRLTVSALDRSVHPSSLSEIGDAAKQFGDTTFKYTDADGKVHEVKVKDALPEFDSLIQGGELADIDLGAFSDAPGLILEIASLGRDLAEIELERARADLRDRDEILELLETAWAEIETARVIADALLHPTSGKIINSRDSTLYAELDRLVKKGGSLNHRSATQGILEELQLFVVARRLMLQTRASIELELARLDHRRSISQSAYADRAWQAVVRTGLESLVAYHQEGLKPEDVANLIRIGQTVALAFIATEVD